MERRIEWNPSHKNSDEQQNEFVDSYLLWSPDKKWNYLMKLRELGSNKSKTKSERQIIWK